MFYQDELLNPFVMILSKFNGILSKIIPMTYFKSWYLYIFNLSILEYCTCMHLFISLRFYHFYHGIPRWLSGKESACQCRRYRFNPWGNKIPWRRNSNPFQYYYWENPTDREVWRATVRGVTKSQTWLSTHECIFIIKINHIVSIKLFLHKLSIGEWLSIHITEYSVTTTTKKKGKNQHQKLVSFWRSIKLINLSQDY